MEITWNPLVKARGFLIEVQADQGSASAKLTVRIQKNLNANTLSGQFMQRLSRMWMTGSPTVAI